MEDDIKNGFNLFNRDENDKSPEQKLKLKNIKPQDPLFSLDIPNSNLPNKQ